MNSRLEDENTGEDKEKAGYSYEEYITKIVSEGNIYNKSEIMLISVVVPMTKRI